MRLYPELTPEDEADCINILRQMTPAETLDIVTELNAEVRARHIKDLRKRYGLLDEKLEFRLLVDIILGEELALTVYGPVANIKPLNDE